jgi:hypothetical protein
MHTSTEVAGARVISLIILETPIDQSLVRTFLNANPTRWIAFHWTPCHVGIDINEGMDKLAKSATELTQSRYTSWSVASQNADSLAIRRWQNELHKPEYTGHSNLITKNEFRFVNSVAKKHWWMRTIDGSGITDSTASKNIYARATRLISGHLPIGEFRKRFNHPGRPTVPVEKKKQVSTCSRNANCGTVHGNH